MAGPVAGEGRELETFLVVDDDRWQLAAAKKVLGESRRVLTAATKSRAFAIIEKAAISAAIVDLCLGPDSGITVIRALRVARPAARIALLTGHLTPQVIADATLAGVNVIATKPMSYRKLTAVLATPSSTVTVLANTFPAPADPVTSTIHAPIDTVVREHARRVVADLGGNKAEAARVLGVARNTLYQLLSPAPADSAADDE